MSLEFTEFRDRFLNFRIRTLYPKHVRKMISLQVLVIYLKSLNFSIPLGFAGIPWEKWVSLILRPMKMKTHKCRVRCLVLISGIYQNDLDWKIEHCPVNTLHCRSFESGRPYFATIFYLPWEKLVSSLSAWHVTAAVRNGKWATVWCGNS